MTIKYCCEIGIAGQDIEGEIEISGDATDEEIDEEVKDEIFNVISWSWEKVGD